MACAVWRLSPVIMATFRPAFLSFPIAGTAESFKVSAIAIVPAAAPSIATKTADLPESAYFWATDKFSGEMVISRS
jgi:hypothetical protein